MNFDRKTTFDVNDVVAAAIAAYKDTNGEIIRSTYITREQGQDKTVYSSRDIALQYLATPERLEPFKAQAEEAIVYFNQHTMMITLMGKENNKFFATVAETIDNSTVIFGNVGLIVWLPKLLDQLRKREGARVEWIEYAAGSTWVPAREGEKVTFDFTLIEKRFLKNKNVWVVAGQTPEGHILSFFSNNEKKIVDKCRITGKVKSFLADKYRNDAKITSLNYVKVIQ